MSIKVYQNKFANIPKKMTPLANLSLPIAKVSLPWQTCEVLAVGSDKSPNKEKISLPSQNKYIYVSLPNNLHIYMCNLAKLIFIS